MVILEWRSLVCHINTLMKFSELSLYHSVVWINGKHELPGFIENCALQLVNKIQCEIRQKQILMSIHFLKEETSDDETDDE